MKRYTHCDILRTIAIFFVLLCHVVGTVYAEDFVPGVRSVYSVSENETVCIILRPAKYIRSPSTQNSTGRFGMDIPSFLPVVKSMTLNGLTSSWQ